MPALKISAMQDGNMWQQIYDFENDTQLWIVVVADENGEPLEKSSAINPLPNFQSGVCANVMKIITYRLVEQ